jgi:hypothetical protein
MADATVGPVVPEQPLLAGMPPRCDGPGVVRKDVSMVGAAGRDDADALGADVRRRVAVTPDRPVPARHRGLRW